MIPPGVALILGAVQHESFGPVVMLGAGGDLADRVFRLAPLDAPEAARTIGTLRMARLLGGYRGGPAVSRVALSELIIRVAALAEDVPQIAEFDLNPAIGRDENLLVVDARIRVAIPAVRPDPILRQLL